jgi:hypothetical protein
MLSVEKCKELLKGREYTAQEVEELRDSLYQLATILVNGYLEKEKPLKEQS